MEMINPCCCCQLRTADKDLNTPYMFLGATETFSSLLEECFQILYTEALDNECGICEMCLRDARDFKLQVQRSQAELRARLVRAQSIKEEDDPIVLNTSQHVDSEIENITSDAEPTVKLESDDTASGGEAIYFGTEAWAPSGPGLVSSRAREQLAMACSVRLERLQHDKMSPRTSPHQSSLTTHMRVRAEQLTERTERRDLTSAAAGAETYTCDTCGEQFARKSAIITHLKKHIAKKSFLNKSSFNLSHSEKTRLKPDSDKPYLCVLCPKKFKRKRDFINHSCEHTGVKVIRCEICNKQFTRTTSLTVHKRTHTGERPYECQVCSKKFSIKSHLSRHNRLHTGEKLYSCHICNKRFSQKKDARLHSNKKLYACEVCPKHFCSTKQLKQHRQMHTRGRRRVYTPRQIFGHNSTDAVDKFNCEICNKKFLYKSNLITHIRYHIGDKPYSCQICSKRYFTSSHLNKHKLTHLVEKPFECEICEKKFSYRQVLNKHIRWVHVGLKAFSCEICARGFPRKDNCDRHQQSCHKKNGKIIV